MKRTTRVSILSLFFVGASVMQPAMAQEPLGEADPQTLGPYTAGDTQPIQVRLPHPLSALEALRIADRLGVRVTRLQNEQAVAGVYFSDSAATPEVSALEYSELVRRDYGLLPEVMEVELARPIGAASAESIEDRFSELASSRPVFHGGFIDLIAAERRSAAAEQRAEDARSTRPPATGNAYEVPPWAPTYAEFTGRNENASIVGMYHYYSWDPQSNAPHRMPNDWGIEFDLSLYNYSLSGTRPFCSNPLYEDAFWAARGTPSGEVIYAGINAYGPSASQIGFYFDGNDASDVCSRQNMGVGIGYPRNLPTEQLSRVEISVVTERGYVSSSPMGLVYDAVSNDCNNVGQRPNSNCMGLNVNRPFPGPGLSFGFALNPSRGVHAPNCFSYLTGSSGPYIGCPS